VAGDPGRRGEEVAVKPDPRVLVFMILLGLGVLAAYTVVLLLISDPRWTP
jgi:hypothetical protein